GGCEETTTGVHRLKARAKEGKLRFPMVCVNDAQMKYLFDNRYGTGQSVWNGINRTTNLVVASSTVVIAGYGWCGKGVAMRAKGLGARVIITEVNPVRAVEAAMDGFDVMTMDEAAPLGDFFVTVTGCKDVITWDHMVKMKQGAILSNAGHFDVEVAVSALRERCVSSRTVRQNIEAFKLPNGRDIYLLAEGRLVNLAAGDGHPAEIMDISFALQALSAEYLVKNASSLTADVHEVPSEIDMACARMKIESLGKHIDSLTKEQYDYLHSSGASL
ncbi:MAG: adenosylhomocysteinase, partial [Clostridia bacterium]|nr:adenosylhomocysteinase [Clostridia bacterium]